MVILFSILILGILGVVFGSGLAFASKKFAVIEDPKVTEITSVLPGANCGVCGQPGCNALAKAIAEGICKVNSCIPGGTECAKKIAKIMGLEVEETVPKIAVVHCQGGKKEAKDRFKYEGLNVCRSANNIAGGHKSCTYGCLGFGDCVQSCKFDALSLSKNGLPVVDENKCTGCGACASICPRRIISLIPKSEKVYVACSSKDKGAFVKEICVKGCFTCTLCANVKVTPSGGISIKDNLPILDYTKEHEFKGAIEKCPAECYVEIA